MRFCRPVSLILLWVTLGFTAFGQKQLVEMREPDLAVTLTAGTSTDVVFPFRILAPYHIQADTVNDENLIRTTLSFETSDNISITTFTYPAFGRFQLKGTPDDLFVFHGDLDIQAMVDASEAAPGDYQLTGELYYQACDEVRCLFPRRLKFRMTVNINP